MDRTAALPPEPPPGWEAALERSPQTSSSAQIWAVVLAGGDGRRLRPAWSGSSSASTAPNSTSLCWSASLLRQTLDRLGASFLPSDVVVSRSAHAQYVAHEAFPRARAARALAA